MKKEKRNLDEVLYDELTIKELKEFQKQWIEEFVEILIHEQNQGSKKITKKEAIAKAQIQYDKYIIQEGWHKRDELIQLKRNEAKKDIITEKEKLISAINSSWILALEKIVEFEIFNQDLLKYKENPITIDKLILKDYYTSIAFQDPPLLGNQIKSIKLTKELFDERKSEIYPTYDARLKLLYKTLRFNIQFKDLYIPFYLYFIISLKPEKESKYNNHYQFMTTNLSSPIFEHNYLDVRNLSEVNINRIMEYTLIANKALEIAKQFLFIFRAFEGNVFTTLLKSMRKVNTSKDLEEFDKDIDEKGDTKRIEFSWFDENIGFKPAHLL